jgi:hypothetical protein
VHWEWKKDKVGSLKYQRVAAQETQGTTYIDGEQMHPAPYRNSPSPKLPVIETRRSPHKKDLKMAQTQRVREEHNRTSSQHNVNNPTSVTAVF